MVTSIDPAPAADTHVVWEPELSDEGRRWQRVVRDLTPGFAELAATLDRDQRYPWEHVRALSEADLTGLLVPRQYGGQGAGLEAATAVAETIATACASTCTVWMSYVVGVLPLLQNGTKEQKSRFAPRIAAGEGISFALSEEATGSDPSALDTTATEEAGGWRLRGRKWMVGNGGASRFFIIFAQVPGDRGISAFLVDSTEGGIDVVNPMDKMGLRGASVCELELDCRVEHSALVGERGRGLGVALQALTVGRLLVAAQSCGVAMSALHEAVKRASSRETFGRPIIERQAIGFRLADAATEISAARALTYNAARDLDDGRGYRELASMAKVYATEMCHRVVDMAVQVFGAEGYAKPSVVERLYRDQRVLEIYEGSSEMQRLTVSRALGKLATATT